MANKKKARRGRSQTSVDPNEQRRARLEARRQAKAEQMQARRKREIRERWVRRLVLFGLITAAIWFLFLRASVPDEINGHTIEDYSLEGANQHTAGDVSYESSPPVSGQHDPQPVACGIYGGPIDDEQLVHTLEHGAVGLVYSPTLDPAAIAQLEAIASERESHVISVPYESEMETPIAITAWGHVMRLETVDRPSIEKFIDEFAAEAGEAPEGFQECDNTQDTPFEPPEAEASPEPDASPEAEPSPEPEPSPSE